MKIYPTEYSRYEDLSNGIYGVDMKVSPIIRKVIDLVFIELDRKKMF